MKRLFAFVLLLCMMLLVVGCNADSADGHKEHDNQVWIKANCQSPKKCAICGYTEGEIGDHNAKVGTCTVCNEFQNKELFDGIVSDLTELSSDLKESYDFLQQTASSFAGSDVVYAAAIETVDPNFSQEKAKLENILAICGQYEELEDIERQVQKAVEYYPVKPSGTTLEESEAYFSNAKMCYFYILEALNQTTFIN